MKERRIIHVYVVSDASGITAERVIQAILVQFRRQVQPIIRRHGRVRTTSQITRILKEAESQGGLVIYSLVDRNLREWMQSESSARTVYIIDLLGPLLNRMTDLFGVLPSMSPGLLGVLGEDSIRLAESIDFAIRHDDGAGIKTLGQAQIIIIGVSRTSKTPTSLYLACNHNIKTANVPIVPGIAPPKKLFTLKRPIKIGLTIEVEKLISIRLKRFKKDQAPSYVDVRRVREELALCRSVFDRIKGIKVIDVTNCSIEEAASQIMQTI